MSSILLWPWGELGTHSEPGPWGWAMCPGKSPQGCAIRPKGALLSAPAPRDRRDGWGTQTQLPAPPAKTEALRAPLEPGP